MGQQGQNVQIAQLNAQGNEQGLLANSYNQQQAINSGVSQNNANNEWKPFQLGLGAAQGGASMATTPGSPTPKADGGPVSPGHPYLVGERGPELIVPQHHGLVVPAPQTQEIRAAEATGAAKEHASAGDSLGQAALHHLLMTAVSPGHSVPSIVQGIRALEEYRQATAKAEEAKKVAQAQGLVQAAPQVAAPAPQPVASPAQPGIRQPQYFARGNVDQQAERLSRADADKRMDIYAQAADQAAPVLGPAAGLAVRAAAAPAQLGLAATDKYFPEWQPTRWQAAIDAEQPQQPEVAPVGQALMPPKKVARREEMPRAERGLL